MKKLLKKRWAKHYHQDNKNRYLHLIVDGLALLIILALLLTDSYLSAKNYSRVLGIQIQENINISQNQNTNNQTTTASDNLTENQTPVVILPTTIKFQASAKYYTAEGEQLGLGPIPPIAGQTTRYWLFIKVAGFSHKLLDVSVSAKLPKNVSLTGKSSVTWGEKIIFNTETGEIKWLLGDLTVENGQETLIAALEVEIIPATEQIGQAATLLDQLEIFALDAVVNKTINQNHQPITTDLTGADGLVQAK